MTTTPDIGLPIDAPTDIGEHEQKVDLVRELLRRDPDMNLYLYAFECPEMEDAALQVANEIERLRKSPDTATRRALSNEEERLVLGALFDSTYPVNEPTSPVQAAPRLLSEEEIAALIREHVEVGYTLGEGGLVDPETIFVNAAGAAHVIHHAVTSGSHPEGER